MASQYLAIPSALINVDFRSDATWSMLSPLTLEPRGEGNGWSEYQEGNDFGFPPLLLCTFEFVGNQKQNLGQPHVGNSEIKIEFS